MYNSNLLYVSCVCMNSGVCPDGKEGDRVRLPPTRGGHRGSANDESALRGRPD